MDDVKTVKMADSTDITDRLFMLTEAVYDTMPKPTDATLHALDAECTKWLEARGWRGTLRRDTWGA